MNDKIEQKIAKLITQVTMWMIEWEGYIWSCVQLSEAKHDKVKMWLLEWNNTWLDHIETYKTNNSIDDVINWIKQYMTN